MLNSKRARRETALDVKEQKERELKERKQSVSAATAQLLPDAISDGFECPITRELMEDPVLLVGDGHSYERTAIETWFSTGRKISPMTGARLTNQLIVPNHNLRKAIQHFLKQQPGLAALLAESQRAKTQEREASDLALAIKLREEDLQKKLAEKAEQKVTAAQSAGAQGTQFALHTVKFVEALDRYLKSNPRLSFSPVPTAAASYASTVMGCFAKPPEVLKDLLDQPENYSIPASVAGFVTRYLVVNGELQELRQHPELAEQLKVALSKFASSKVTDLSGLLQQLSQPAVEPTAAVSSSSSSSSSSPSLSLT